MGISPDNHWVVTGSRDGTVRMWDLTAKDWMASLNFDQLIDREPALIKDRGRKRSSRYWLRGRDVFEQIKGPLLKS